MTLVTVQAPAGAHFEYEKVRTAGGEKDLGDAPILVWTDLKEVEAKYTTEGVLGVLDGTSLRVSYQGIARRGRIKGKTDDQIAQEQLEFKPGNRAVGESTPVSRARRAAAGAAEKVDGDVLAKFLQAVAEGKISAEDVASLAQ